jgi:hypothetical protein
MARIANHVEHILEPDDCLPPALEQPDVSMQRIGSADIDSANRKQIGSVLLRCSSSYRGNRIRTARHPPACYFLFNVSGFFLSHLLRVSAADEVHILNTGLSAAGVCELAE